MTRPVLWMLLASLLLGIVGCSGGDKPAEAPTPAATTPSTGEAVKPAAPVVEISPFVHHTAGDVALVIARPSRALSNPIVTGLIQEIEAADPSVKFEEELKKLQDELQIDPKQVEYVVVSVSSQTLAAVTPKPQGPPDFGPPPVEVPQAPEASDGEPKVPGTEPPPADTNAHEPSTDEKKESPCADESAAAGAEEPVAPVELTEVSSGELEEGMDPFAPPPSPAVLVRLLTPVDGDALVAKMVARDKANVEKMFGDSTSNSEGLDKELVEDMKKKIASELDPPSLLSFSLTNKENKSKYFISNLCHSNFVTECAKYNHGSLLSMLLDEWKAPFDDTEILDALNSGTRYQTLDSFNYWFNRWFAALGFIISIKRHF